MVTARTDVVIGIVFSKYDEIHGPDAHYWVPGELGKDVRRIVSTKTLNMLSGDETQPPSTLEIISFPAMDQKGMIKFFKITDPTKRGGFVNATITLLFAEKDASIFYKYREEFISSFDEFALKVINLEKGGGARDYLETFNQFNEEINAIIKNLFEKEVGLYGESEFPAGDEGGNIKYRTYKFKVIVVGDPEVGKTSIILRYTENAFRRTYITTIGVNVTAKNLLYNDRKVKFAIWDIAGQSKFNFTRRHFYDGAQGVIIVFDLTRPPTFESVSRWYEDIKQCLDHEFPAIILGNKADLVKDTSIPTNLIEKIAQNLNAGYIESSALEGKNIHEAFTYLAALLVNRGKEVSEEE